MLTDHPVRVLLARVPDWPLLAARRRAGLDADTSLLVSTAGRVLTCCPRALAEGVEPGLPVRSARVRCPGAVVVEDDPQVSEGYFDRVVTAVEEAVAPGVHVVRPGVLAVRCRGAARFHGGEQAAAGRLWQVLAGEGHPDALVGVADGLFAAETATRVDPSEGLLARADARVRIVAPGGSPAFLAPLPITLLASRSEGSGDAGPSSSRGRHGGAGGRGGDGSPRGWPSLVTDLQQLGLATLGHFAALDTAAVVGRFGPLGARAHDLARGRDLAVLAPRTPPRDDVVEAVSEEPLALAAEVVELVRPGVEALMADLAARGRVCAQARVIVRSTGGICEHTWRQPWQFTGEDLLRRVVRQLAELPDAVAAGSGAPSAGQEEQWCQRGVEAVRIIPTVHRAAEASEGLFGARPRAHLVQVVTRLQDRLGPEAVVTPSVVGGRLLKDRRLLTPFGTLPATTDRPSDRPWPGHLEGPAPALVYDRPPAVRLEDAQGGPAERMDPQRPCWLRTGATRRRVIAWAGPWPLRQRWWSGQATAVERFQLVTEDQQAWLVATTGGRWWVEARYEAG